MNLPSLSLQRAATAGAVWLAGLCFGAALALPVVSVTPGAGELTAWARMLKPDAMATVTQTLPGGISHLWMEGDHFLSLVLAMFCMVLPAAKFAVLGAESAGMRLTAFAAGRWVVASAPFAMVEVFLLALLVLVIKGLPGGSLVKPGAGAWFFAASVLLSWAASVLLKRAPTGG